MRRVEITLYRFNELSPRAQENAIHSWRDHWRSYHWSKETTAGSLQAGGYEYTEDGREWDPTLEK